MNKLRGDNQKAEKLIKDLERKSDINYRELQQFKGEIEEERRQTLVN